MKNALYEVKYKEEESRTIYGLSNRIGVEMNGYYYSFNYYTYLEAFKVEKRKIKEGLFLGNWEKCQKEEKELVKKIFLDEFKEEPQIRMKILFAKEIVEK